MFQPVQQQWWNSLVSMDLLHKCSWASAGVWAIVSIWSLCWLSNKFSVELFNSPPGAVSETTLSTEACIVSFAFESDWPCASAPAPRLLVKLVSKRLRWIFSDDWEWDVMPESAVWDKVDVLVLALGVETPCVTELVVGARFYADGCASATFIAVTFFYAKILELKSYVNDNIWNALISFSLTDLTCS